MTYSDKLWEQNTPIYQQIITHPFNIELANGTLTHERFVFYMVQDSYYLMGFSKALALIAGRANSSRIINDFLHFALGALIVERELHAKFLPPNYNWDNCEPTLSCLAYTQFLIATSAIASLEEAVAAVLPCFWIYREVGLDIAKKTVKNNPYVEWIDTYSSPEFADVTEKAINLLNEMAQDAAPKLLAAMEKAFKTSTLLEWHFWDDAYAKVRFGPIESIDE